MNARLKQEDIVFLFDEVWPRMEYSAVYRDSCLARLEVINSLFERYADSADKLLRALDALDGIGLVIGSGLIFAANRETMVPFDKYTMGWALELCIIPDNRISIGSNYSAYSRKVVEHIRKSEHLHSILDFVREADYKAQFPYSPE